MKDPIRILVADDSPTVRRHLMTLIEEHADMCVVGEARTGQEAVAMVADLRPHVVSMDIHMPDTDGLEATRQIMTHTPTPIVIVSDLLDADVALSLKALEAGALAVIQKPVSRQHMRFDEQRHHLLKTLRAMAQVKVVSRRRLSYPKRQTAEMPSLVRGSQLRKPELIVIGASTGGPKALFYILKALPADFPVPIIIVQHMPMEFIAGFAEWLNRATPLDVVVADDPMRIERGRVIVAAGHQHVVVERSERLLRIATKAIDEMSEHYIPSIDALFTSVADVVGQQAIGIILTGMGNDGAQGLLAIRQAGGQTVVQDADSSVVFGMPKAAIALHAAQNVVPLSEMATKILKLL